MTRDSITAEISNSVAENAVCWCDGRKKRSSFVIETRSDVPSYRNLNWPGSCAASTPRFFARYKAGLAAPLFFDPRNYCVTLPGALHTPPAPTPDPHSELQF